MMDLSNYEYRFSVLLQNAIEAAPHIDTGALYRSIMFIITEYSGGLDVQLLSEYYIIFLDHGTFLEEFYESIEFTELMKEMVTEYITTKLDEI